MLNDEQIDQIQKLSYELMTLFKKYKITEDAAQIHFICSNKKNMDIEKNFHFNPHMISLAAAYMYEGTVWGTDCLIHLVNRYIKEELEELEEIERMNEE